MELIINKSIFIFLFFSSILSFSTTTSATSEVPSELDLNFFLPDSPSPSPAVQASHPTFSSFNITTFIAMHFPKVPTSSIHSSLENICSVTQNPKMCVTLLASHVTQPVTPLTSLQAVIKTLDVLVKDASFVAMDVHKDPSTPLKLKKSLEMSMEQYWRASNSIGHASAAFSSHDIEEVKSMLVVAVTNFGFADEAFYKHGLKKSPMNDINEFLIQFAEFGIDISSNLTKNY